MSNFREIRDAVAGATGVLEFDLDWLHPELASKFDPFFSIQKGLIYLHDLDNLVVEDDRLSFSGRVEIRRSGLYFEIWIAIFTADDGLDYVITIEPGGSWVQSLASPVGEALAHFDFDLSDTLFYFTTLENQPLRVTFDGGDTFRTIPRLETVGALTLLDSDLLDILGLEPQVFSIRHTATTGVHISTELSVSVPLGPFLTVEVDRVALEVPESVTVEGSASVPFLAGEQLAASGRVRISRTGFEGELETGGVFELPMKPFLGGIELRDLKAHVGGAHATPAAATYGVSGRLVLDGQEPAPLTQPGRTMRHGDFDIRYSSAQAGPVPVLFEAYLEEAGLATAAGLLTGNRNLVPEALDDLLKFRSTYLYWCSSPQVIRNGVPAKVGAGASTLFEFLSLLGYGELRVRSNGDVGGRLLLEPLVIGSLVELRGDSSGTPPGFDGPAIEPGGIELVFDSAGGPYLNTAVSIRLFDRIEAANVAARVDDNGLAFHFSTGAIPLVEQARFECEISGADRFRCAAAFNLALADLRADLGPLGKFRVSLDVSCGLDCEVGPGDHARAELVATASLSGMEIALALAFDAAQLGQDLFDLETILRTAILKRIESLLREPAAWLQALLGGAIEAAEELLASARELAEVLEREFGVVAESAAEVLREAGMVATKAVEILTDGFGKAPDEAARLMREAGYSVQEIANGLLAVLDGSAKEVFKILRAMEVPAQEIGKALRSVASELEKQLKHLDIAAKEAADLLRGLGRTADQAGDLVHSSLNAGKDVLDGALRAASYPAKEVTSTINRIFGGGGGGGGGGPRLPIGRGRHRICIGWGC